MRVLILVKLAMIALLLSSCDSNSKKGGSEKSESVETETVDSIDVAEKDQNKAADTDGFLAALQGEWERTTYPHGTVIFKGNQVKFVAGEGEANPPQFQNFRLADACPYSDSKDKPGNYLDFMVLKGTKECNSVKINGDTLSVAFTAQEPGIVYTRSKTGENANSSIDKENHTISESIRGTWALGDGNCGKQNNQQIIIDARSIQYFEKKAELLKITEYEPTRIAGKFNYKLSDGTVLPYQMTLDAQENGKVLIVREYGKDATPGPIRYVRCN